MIPDAELSVEKRKHPRITVQVAATYRSATVTLDTHAVNLSQTGAFLSGRPADPVGAEVEVSLVFGRLPITLSAVVAWRGSGGVGVRFRDLSREQRLALANFLIARFCSG